MEGRRQKAENQSTLVLPGIGMALSLYVVMTSDPGRNAELRQGMDGVKAAVVVWTMVW
jgi:hypothetical protein